MNCGKHFIAWVLVSIISGIMGVRVRVDSRGRIVIPKEFREALGIWEGDEVILTLSGNKLVIEKCEDPFKVLEEVLKDLTFDRSLRRVAERSSKVSWEGGRSLGWF